MKRILVLLLGCITATTLLAATADEVTAWKRDFPTVGVETSFGLRNLVTQYETAVRLSTPENIYATVRTLRQRAERDLEEASKLAKSGKGPTAQEARQKRDWLMTRFLPFVRKMG